MTSKKEFEDIEKNYIKKWEEIYETFNHNFMQSAIVHRGLDNL